MKYLVFDVSNMLYRTFEAHRKGRDEVIMGLAVHTALMSMMKFYRKFKPNKIIACFDNKSWRKPYTKSDKCISKRIYKGNRRADMTPTEKEIYAKFLEHINALKDLLESHTTMLTLCESGLEADDFMAGVAQIINLKSKNDEIVVVTSDKDMMQLLKYDNVQVYDPKTGKPRTLAEWNNDAELFLFEKCIRGDRGDNVQNAYPGIRRTRILKAYTDEFEWENIKKHKLIFPGDTPEGTEVLVGSLIKENRKLMDLECQPNDIRKKMYAAILREMKKDKKFSYFHFQLFCGEHDLKKVAEKSDNFIEMFAL